MLRNVKIWRIVWPYLQVVLGAVVVALLLKTYVVDAIVVPSHSMEQTLLVGDYVIVNKLIHGNGSGSAEAGIAPLPAVRRVERGDVVVFRTPFDSRSGETIFVKRCIAVSGDEIAIEKGTVLVNGVRMPLERGRTDESFGPVVVPKNHLFVMGDNRDHSFDSREWGFLPEENVIGKATFIYWSVDNENGIRWNRVGTLIH